MLFVLFCILLCVSIILWQSKRSKATAPALPPAYRGELPLIGHAHILLTDTTNMWLRFLSMCDYAVQQGGVIYFKLGPNINYLITDPDDAMTVANNCLQKHQVYDFAEPWVGQGLITATGEIWQRHRKLLNPAFSLPMIHGFLEIFNCQSKQLKHNLDQHVGEAAFDPSSYIFNFILTVTCMTVFGDKDIKDEQFYSKYMKAVDEMMNIMMTRVAKVWFHNKTLHQLFGDGKKERDLLKSLKGMANEVIKRKRDVNGNGNISYISHRPFIDIMMDHGKETLSDEEIRDELDTTIAAGYETSSSFLRSALVLIGSYPEIQEKMYKEMMEVIGEDRDVGKEDLQKLVYTDAVIKECLRFISTIPIIARCIDKEIKLKNYTLRANTDCLLMMNSVNKSTAWGADVNQFKPERWLDPNSVANNSKLFATFGLGKRACIGKVYAVTLFKIAFTHIVRAFKISADHTKLKFKVDISLKPVAGNEIRLQRRH